jgi:PhnB protein
MKPNVKPIPEGYEGATPYLVVQGAAAAIDFYRKAFGAKEIMRMPGPKGAIGHADILVAGGHVMLADESPEMGHRGPQSLGGSPVSLVLYVENVDDVVKRAVGAGAKLTRPVENQFYGDRAGAVTDPFGHVWHIMTHIEDVSIEEMVKRGSEMARAVET